MRNVRMNQRTAALSSAAKKGLEFEFQVLGPFHRDMKNSSAKNLLHLITGRRQLEQSRLLPFNNLPSTVSIIYRSDCLSTIRSPRKTVILPAMKEKARRKKEKWRPKQKHESKTKEKQDGNSCRVFRRGEPARQWHRAFPRVYYALESATLHAASKRG